MHSCQPSHADNVTTDTVNGGTESALTDRATPCDDDGSDSIVIPCEEVKVEYDGEYVESAELGFQSSNI